LLNLNSAGEIEINHFLGHIFNQIAYLSIYSDLPYASLEDIDLRNEALKIRADSYIIFPKELFLMKYSELMVINP
jgi:hypothetical protein